MTKCPTCGQRVESEREKLGEKVFVFTSMTVLVWGMVLFTSTWTVAWFAERRDLIIFFAAILVIAIYFWVQFLQEPSHHD